MKGVIAAGGLGTRLYPITNNISKHLLPIYNKPLIYYPLTTLIATGIREICIVGNKEEINNFKLLLGNGTQIGCRIEYNHQPLPLGIPDVINKAEEVFGKSPITLILGDNIITASDILIEALKEKKIKGSRIFLTKVQDPSRYGVATFDKKMNIKNLVEKPKNPKSDYAIIGLYVFDELVFDEVKKIKPSRRGELEIIDVLNQYKKRNSLYFNILKRGTVWFDAGTPDSLNRANNYIQLFEKQSGTMIGSIEEAAYTRGFIEKNKLLKLCSAMPESDYKYYLLNFLK